MLEKSNRLTTVPPKNVLSWDRLCQVLLLVRSAGRAVNVTPAVDGLRGVITTAIVTLQTKYWWWYTFLDTQELYAREKKMWNRNCNERGIEGKRKVNTQNSQQWVAQASRMKLQLHQLIIGNGVVAADSRPHFPVEADNKRQRNATCGNTFMARLTFVKKKTWETLVETLVPCKFSESANLWHVRRVLS